VELVELVEFWAETEEEAAAKQAIALNNVNFIADLRRM